MEPDRMKYSKPDQVVIEFGLPDWVAFKKKILNLNTRTQPHTHPGTHTNTNKSQLIRLAHTTLFNPHYTVTPNGHRQGANG